MGKKKCLTHLTGSDIFRALKTWLFIVTRWKFKGNVQFCSFFLFVSAGMKPGLLFTRGPN